MEYKNLEPQFMPAQRISSSIGDVADDSYNKYVLYDQSLTPTLKYLFSDKNIELVQSKLYELLKCMRKDGRPVIVTKRVIADALSEIQENMSPQLADIYSVFNIPQDQLRDDILKINNMTIEFIYTQLKTEYEMEENNKNLTVWTTLYGDFNEHGLRQYSQLRLNHKPINKFRFNMNY